MTHFLIPRGKSNSICHLQRLGCQVKSDTAPTPGSLSEREAPSPERLVSLARGNEVTQSHAPFDFTPLPTRRSPDQSGLQDKRLD